MAPHPRLGWDPYQESGRAARRRGAGADLSACRRDTTSAGARAARAAHGARIGSAQAHGTGVVSRRAPSIPRVVRDGGAARGERRSRRRSPAPSACSAGSRRCTFRSAATCSIPVVGIVDRAARLQDRGVGGRAAARGAARPAARSRPSSSARCARASTRASVSDRLALLRDRWREGLGRHGDGARRVAGDGCELNVPLSAISCSALGFRRARLSA